VSRAAPHERKAYEEGTFWIARRDMKGVASGATCIEAAATLPDDQINADDVREVL
jgi:hypothetical protein